MATKKTPAKKAVAAKKPAAIEFYWLPNNDSLYEAVDSVGAKSLDDVAKEVQEYIEGGETVKNLYIYKVERLPVKKITTTVTITD